MSDNGENDDFITNYRKEKLQRIRENLQNGIWTKDFKHRSKGEKTRSSNASEESRKRILDFEKEWGYLGKSIQTRLQYVSILHNFAEHLESKPFKDVTKEDLIDYFDKLKNQGNTGKKGIKENSITSAQAVIKVFYKWLNGGEDYPDCVKWMRAKFNQNHITSDDILTEGEVKTMITSAGSFRNKAVVAVLFESVCRISEFLGMRIRDVKFDIHGAVIRVNGKTGEREVRLVNSVPYLKEWLKVHPTKDSPDSYVWVIESEGRGRRDSEKSRHLKEHGINALLKRLAEKCGIEKRVYPHLLRHSNISLLAAKLSGTLLNNYVGWKTSSKMSEIYVHHSRNEIDKAVLNNVYNIRNLDKAQEIVDRLLPQICHNCGEKNIAEVDYCTKCNWPLKEEETKSRAKRNELIVKNIFSSPETIRLIIQQEVRRAVDELIKLRSR